MGPLVGSWEAIGDQVVRWVERGGRWGHRYERTKEGPSVLRWHHG